MHPKQQELRHFNISFFTVNVLQVVKKHFQIILAVGTDNINIIFLVVVGGYTVAVNKKLTYRNSNYGVITLHYITYRCCT